MTEVREDPLTRFNSCTSELKCQLLKLSMIHTGCTTKTEYKQVEGGIDPFLMYSLFEPGPKEPTLLPYTDEFNNEDYFLLGTGYTDSLIEGTAARMLDSHRYSNVIGMTVYDENYNELVESMRGVLLKSPKQNLDLNRTLVVIVADGCDVLNQDKPVKKELTAKLKDLGLYDRDRVKKLRRHWDTYKKPSCEVCFVFEADLTLNQAESTRPNFVQRRCWQSYEREAVSLARYNGEEKAGVGHVTTLFVVKPYNKKKLHSHLWLMYGFCIFMNPLFVYVTPIQLIDIGTEATPGSLAALDTYMCKHPSVGGCCGEIIVKDWKPRDADFVDVMALMAQWFEYKMGHILNKPLEDIMGYIGVLPGAFSCYRWDALAANDFQVLGQYFRPFIAPHTLPWKLSNIYHLAEDRIMSEEIIKLKHKRPFYDTVDGRPQQVGVSQRKIGYTLGFVKSAKALTEGAPSLVMLIKQRRRWINGGWFAMIKMVLGGSTLTEIRTSGHSTARKFWLLVELLYLFIVISFTWVSVGAYYLGFIMAMLKTVQPNLPNLYQVVRYVYIFHIIMIFVMALSLKPESSPKLWKYFVCLFAAVSYFLLGTVIYLIVFGDFNTAWVRFVLLAIFGVMALAAFLYGEEYLKIGVAAFGYIAFLPTYINILSIYSVCKTDDISWGTRGTETSEAQSYTERSFSRLKTWYLLFFITCNVFFGAGFENVNRSSNDATNSWNAAASQALQILYGVALGVLLFPFFAMLLYLFLRCIRCCRRSSKANIENRRQKLKEEREFMVKNEDEMKRAGLKTKLKTLLPPTSTPEEENFNKIPVADLEITALNGMTRIMPEADILIDYRE